MALTKFVLNVWLFLTYILDGSESALPSGKIPDQLYLESYWMTVRRRDTGAENGLVDVCPGFSCGGVGVIRGLFDCGTSPHAEGS
jgi:hypothetical protein